MQQSVRFSQSLELALHRVARQVARQLGLDYPPEQWRDLYYRLGLVARDLGLPDAETAIQVLGDLPHFPHSIVDALICHLTITETYFFREKPVFDVLEQEILPDLIRSRQHTGRFLRIWSAGCSTGEEIYSVAILLTRLLPDLAQWNLTLIGTDVNPAVLKQARGGIYRDWSFRMTPEAIRSRFFTRTSDQTYQLDPQVCSLVRFERHNLASDAFPPPLAGPGSFDLILCRNVLMYFAPETRRRLLQQFTQCLTAPGWFFSSLNEVASINTPALERKYSPNAIIFHKSGRELTLIQPALPFNPEPVPPGFEPVLATTLPAAIQAATPRLTSEPVLRLTPARDWQKLPAGGNISATSAHSQSLFEADKLDPVSHFLEAVTQSEQGDTEAALRGLRQVIFLDPDFILAHYLTGVLYQSQGKFQLAQRAWRNALVLLNRQADTELVAHAEGITVGRVKAMIGELAASKEQGSEITSRQS